MKPRLIGTWSLRGYQCAGNQVNPWGKAVGQLHYGANGQMSLHIMKPKRPRFAKNDMFHGTPAEIREAYEGYLAYWGTYTVQDSALIVHHITGSTYPNWVGRSQYRSLCFSNQFMIQRTPLITASGLPTITELIWSPLGRADQ